MSSRSEPNRGRGISSLEPHPASFTNPGTLMDCIMFEGTSGG